ncbi:MAG: bile acid:sodium symporter [Candidatus Microbacterium colombiense]|nr:MAG: bile acid:sodium symporter [Microbacterium sp.]
MAETTPAPWLERHQIALYLGALGVAAVVGWALPGSSHLEPAIEPVLGLLLFVTFLGVPFHALGDAFRDVRFLIAVGILNFLVVPAVVFGLTRFIAADDALLIGVLLVLLTPCIDYVIVFAGLAGGASAKLLAAAPLLMLAQIVLLPVYLALFVDGGTLSLIDPLPFVRAFLVLIVLPLAAAVLVQLLVRVAPSAAVVQRGMGATMVPLMMATLAIVVASQMRGVAERLGTLIVLVPIYLAFAVILVVLGLLAGRFAGLAAAEARALTFSGVTRNSLVVLPLALALPAPLELAPLVVVTQTLVELFVMVALVRVLPRLIPVR